MKIATTIGEMYLHTASPAEAVRSYEGTGFRYLDYSFYNDYMEKSPFMQDDESCWIKEVEETAAAASECGFRFVQAHAPGYNPLRKSDYERSLRAMCRSVEACGRLHIPNIVVHTSFGQQHLYPMDKEPYFEYNRKFLLPMLRCAEKYGVNICIENTSSKNMGACYFPRTPEDMLDFLDFMKHPLLKCCWDTGHAVMEGRYDQTEEFRTLGPNLAAVHIHDNNALSDQHLPLYCGKLDPEALVKALVEIDFKGFFTYEVDGFMNRVNSSGPARKVPLEIRRECLSLLYKTAKFLLDSYGVFEE